MMAWVNVVAARRVENGQIENFYDQLMRLLFLFTPQSPYMMQMRISV